MRLPVITLLFFVVLQACTSKPSATEKPVEDNVIVKPKGLLLIETNDCQTCHHVKNTLVGPSLSAIAAKYDESEEVVTTLAAKVIKGGTGVWGDMSMNAHPALSEEEAQEMVRYILTLETLPQ